MNENTSKINLLLWKSIEQGLTNEEKAQLDNWKVQSPVKHQLIEGIGNRKSLLVDIKRYSDFKDALDVDLDDEFEKIVKGTQGKSKGNNGPYWLAAASVLAIVFISMYLFLKSEKIDTPNQASTESGNKIGPGKYKARLVLDDGTIVLLDSAKSGRLTTQGSVMIDNGNGQLLYKLNDSVNSSKALHNTLMTGSGETYIATLADGTKIWLNAQSSIRYAAAFADHERVVELNGEAYFEVRRDVARPFRVKVNSKLIQVLGTSFVVKAYPDDKFKTSLLHGQVKITVGDKSKILNPGQQVIISKNDSLQFVSSADVYAEIGWTRGQFYFPNEELHTVLRQLARWYSVGVEYHGSVENESFTGFISREIGLAEVLENISGMTPVKFEVKNNTIHVYGKE